MSQGMGEMAELENVSEESILSHPPKYVELFNEIILLQDVVADLERTVMKLKGEYEEDAYMPNSEPKESVPDSVVAVLNYSPSRVANIKVKISALRNELEKMFLD